MDNNKTPSYIHDVPIEKLRQKSLHSGALAIGNQFMKFVLQIGSTMILARLLTPGDFGLVAMVSALLGFVLMFREFGLSTATIQKEMITHEELSGLFWINLMTGIIILIIFAFCAPIIASFYEEPRAQKITIAFGGIALLSSLGAQHSALLQRQMRFGMIAVRDLSALTVGILLGVIAALLQYGVWALIIMQAATSAVETVIMWCKSGWWPGPPRRTKGINQLLRFGGALTVSNFMAYANHNLDNILLGKYFGDTAVGIYSKAQGILNRPLSQVLPPIMSVVTPMFSRLAGDQARFGKAAIQVAKITCFGGCLLIMGVFPTADWIVDLLLGNQWKETIPIFKIMAVFGLMEPLAWFLGTVLVAYGKPEAMAKWRAVTMILVLTSFIIGLPWGVLGVAVGYTVSGICTRLWLFFFVGKRIGISGVTFIRACAPFVLIACSITILLTLFRTVWEPANAAIGIISFYLIGTIIYISMLACTSKGRKFLKEICVLGQDSIKGLIPVEK